MSESVVADFVASARYDAVAGTKPVQSRVLLSEERLVLASDAGRTVIPLSAVVDVIASGVPAELGGFFDQSVLIAYEDGPDRRTAVVSGDHEPVDRFALYLYKAALHGEGATLRHPTKVGGRVLDPAPRQVSVTPTADAVRFRDEDGVVEIDLGDVVHVTQDQHTIDGRVRAVLVVSHHVEGQTVTSEILHENADHLTLLARHLRSEYEAAAEILQEVDLEDREIAALVSLYSGLEPASLDRVLADEAADRQGDHQGTVEGDAPAGDEIVQELESQGLLADAETGELTHEGALVALHRMADIAE